jgi:hypothetical protein
VYLCVLADPGDQEMNDPLDVSLLNKKYSLVLRINEDGISAESSDFVKSWYSESQLEALYVRIVHRFYRSHACLLCEDHLFDIRQVLTKKYDDSANYKLQLDAATVYCDVLMFSKQHQESDQFPLQLKLLAARFLLRHRFEQAASMFEDIGALWQHLCPDKFRKSNHAEEVGIWELAGLARYRLGNFLQAEGHFLHALGVDFLFKKEWHLNDERNAFAFAKLRRLYMLPHVVPILLRDRLISADEAPAVDMFDKRLYPILTGLLLSAGVDEEAFRINSDLLTSSTRQVKPKFVASQEAAENAIRDALGFRDNATTPASVDEFRKTILSYHNAKRKPFKLKLDFPEDWVLELGIERDFQTVYTPWVYFEKCDNCGKSFATGTISFCPCEEVGYCGKDCRKYFCHPDDSMFVDNGFLLHFRRLAVLQSSRIGCRVIRTSVRREPKKRDEMNGEGFTRHY